VQINIILIIKLHVVILGFKLSENKIYSSKINKRIVSMISQLLHQIYLLVILFPFHFNDKKVLEFFLFVNNETFILFFIINISYIIYFCPFNSV
jgi:hypothetical protein